MFQKSSNHKEGPFGFVIYNRPRINTSVLVEIDRWCDNNCSGNWGYKSTEFLYARVDDRNGLIPDYRKYVFKYIGDALAFYITWSDLIEAEVVFDVHHPIMWRK